MLQILLVRCDLFPRTAIKNSHGEERIEPEPEKTFHENNRIGRNEPEPAKSFRETSRAGQPVAARASGAFRAGDRGSGIRRRISRIQSRGAHRNDCNCCLPPRRAPKFFRRFSGAGLARSRGRDRPITGPAAFVVARLGLGAAIAQALRASATASGQCSMVSSDAVAHPVHGAGSTPRCASFA